MGRFKEDGFIRDNIFGKELIWNKHKYIFTKPRERRHMRHLFIFNLVKLNAQKWIEQHTVKITKWLPSVHYNDKVKHKGKRIIGTDIDGAYWKIAYSLGVISQKTYDHGIRINNKMLCLAALSSLGADKSYRVIKDGMITDDFVVVKGNDKLKEIYKKIRLSCFTIMKELASMLGDDFVLYRTDCIYYIHTPANVQLVTQFLADNELEFKMVHDIKTSLSKKY